MPKTSKRKDYHFCVLCGEPAEFAKPIVFCEDTKQWVHLSCRSTAAWTEYYKRNSRPVLDSGTFIANNAMGEGLLTVLRDPYPQTGKSPITFKFSRNGIIESFCLFPQEAAAMAIWIQSHLKVG